MTFTLPPLPYAEDALEPYLSAKTLQFHHGKHHKTYVDTLNKLVEEYGLEGQTMEQLITSAYHDESKTAVFNNAAQAWNHSLFWRCMTKNGGGEPGGELAKAIKHDFGSFDKFAEDFEAAAVSQFGSGWAWLTFDAGRLKIIKTPNAVSPIAGGQVALLTCDVWEHAYYLDYQNRRPDFVKAFVDNLINWDFVAENFTKARQNQG
ncbi:MAG TPA: superoxide dismutase [Stellaceae bacterium]|nr:superoxide dismutase [Stellaceae bacterium]